MSIRDRASSQQVLAVALALVMLLSVGGMVFAGGVGAQTGGTFDSLFEEQQDISSDVNIDSANQVQLVGQSTGFNDPSVNDDGSVDIDAAPGASEFSGVTVSDERVASLFGADADPATEQADLLTEVVDGYSVNGTGDVGFAGNDDAYPAIFIEYDPQSNFSQISGPDDDVNGEHDYLVVAADGDQNVNAYSVDNNGGEATTTLVSGASSFGAVFDALVGTEDTDLQNQNIDDVTFAAGVGLDDVTTFDSATFNGATVSDLRISDGTDEKLINNEKIALNPDGDTQYYSSIGDHPNGAPSALDDAEAGDTIDVAAGSYDTFENEDPLVVDKGVTISGANNGAVDTRVNTDQTLVNADSETKLNLNVDVTADDATLQNVVISPTGQDAGGHVDVDADGSEIANSVVLQSGPHTGIDVTSDAGTSTTIDNVAVIAETPSVVDAGDIGLALTTQAGENVSVTDSLFVGHQTQIAGNDNVDETTFLGQFEGNAEAQSAVAVNDTDVVQDNAIYGNINDADTAATDSTDDIEVSAGTYDHNASVVIGTADVTIEDVDDAATIDTDGLTIEAAGDVTVDGFTVDGDFTATDGSPDALTVNDTDVATNAGAFDINNIATVSLDRTVGDNYNLGGSITDVTLTETEGDAYDIDATGDVVTTDATGDSFNIATDGDVNATNTDANAGAVTIDATAVDVVGGSANNYDVNGDPADVTITGVTAEPAPGTNGIDVVADADDIKVTDSTVTLTSGDTGVALEANGAAGETINVTDVTVDGNNNSATGISLDTINTDNNNTYTIEDNTVENVANNGVGVAVTEDGTVADGETGSFNFVDNAIQGGSEFIGLSYNLPETSSTTITDNEIIGADVDGGANSVGIDFVDVDNFGGGGIIDPDPGSVMTFERNVITGHARLIQDQGANANERTVTSGDYSAIANSSNELENQIGTVVLDADGDYQATYGSTSTLYNNGGVTYLPGSIDEALTLVDRNPNINEADLQVYEPSVDTTDVDSADVPDRYVDDPVTFPTDEDAISVTGENIGDDDAVTVETEFTLADGDAKNNHAISNLELISDGDAITVDSNSAQSTFSDLDVTANNGAGLIVNADSSDVNVITVERVDFDVDEDGVELSGGAAGPAEFASDDRDGFTLEDVTIDGSSIGDGYTGLNLTDVEKPGKDGIEGLTINGLTVNDFATQVAVGGDLPSEVDAEAFANNATVNVDGVSIQDTEFSHAVLVEQSNGDLRSDDLYGSVDTADDVASDGADDVIDVRNAGNAYDHSATVAIDTNDVTVSGAEGVEILNPIDVSGTGDVALETLTVTAPDGADILSTTKGGTDKAVIGTNNATDLTVRDAVVTTTLDPADDVEMPVGIGASDDASSLTIEDTDIGVEGEAEIGTAIVAENGVDLTVTGSDLYDGATVIDTDGGDTLISEAYGIVAGTGTSPEITDTNISGFDEDGINTLADNLTLTGGMVSDNNAEDNSVTNGIGGVVTDGDVASTDQYKIDGTDIENNAGPGVQLVGVDLTMEAATVSGNAGDGVSVDGDDVTISDDTTIENNDAMGADLTVANATVEDSTVSANGNGLAVDADNDVTVDNNTVSSHDGSAVDVAATTASVTDNTVTDNGQGAILNLSDGANSTVTLNELEDNGVGLTVVSGAEDLTVTGNNIQSTDTDIELNDGTAELDATLNYFGDNGPEADSAAGLDEGDGTIVYDPFLTTDQTDSTVSDITETADFGHDVIVPEPEDGGSTYVAVGFPAQLEGVGASGDATVGDYVDSSSEGQVYAFNATDQTFEPASEDTPINAFDALVIENADAGDRVVSIAYADDRTPSATSDNRLEFSDGLNFVAPQQAGSVDEALFPGGDTDAVIQPFAAGENLYGDTDADQVRDSFVDPSSPQAFGNFRSGVGDATVHPHVGYFVIVNEESNEGLEVTEQIPVPDSPTADNIADRTNADANTITNADTGDTYTDIQVALDEAQDGDTLRLGAGTYESAADPALVREDDITITGAGATSVIDSNVTVDGDNVEFRDLTIVGEFTVNGNNVRSQDVDVQANSPGDVTLNGNDASLTDTSIEKNLAVNGENTRVSNSNVGGTLSINANNTEVTGTTRGATTVGANVDTGTLDLGQEVAFDLSEIDGDSFESGTTDNERNVTLTVEEDLAANDDYTVRMTVTGPDGSEVDLKNDDNITVSDVSIGDFQLDSQPVKNGNEFYIAESEGVATRSGSELNTLSEVGSEGIEGSITFDVDSNAVTGDYDLEMTVVQYDGQEVVEVNETGEATVDIVANQQ